MRKTAYIFLFSMLFVACDKMPINGDLDGMWQLTCIERFNADGTEPEVSYQKDIFWSFQLHLMQLGSRKYYGRFENTGDSMRIYNLTSASKHETADDDDIMLTVDSLPNIHKYGLYRLDTHFKIERLNEDAMRLKSDDARLTFRKF